MNTSDLIELLKDYEEEAGGPLRVDFLVRHKDNSHRGTLDQFDVEIDDSESGKSVLIDLS